MKTRLNTFIMLMTIMFLAGCASDRRFVKSIKPGFYAGGSLGYVSPEFELENGQDADVTEGHSFNLRAGYRLNPSFAVELEYSNVQDVDAETNFFGRERTDELAIVNYALKFLGIIPIQEHHEVFVSLGGGLGDWEDEFDPFAQAGIGYGWEVTDGFVIRPEVIFLKGLGDLDENDLLEGRLGFDIRF